MTPAIPETLRANIDRIQRMALVVGAIGVALCIVQLFLNQKAFFQSWLFAYLYWNGMVIGSLGVLLMHNVVGGNWGVVIRRIAEAAASTIPITFIGLIPVLLGVRTLYVWTDPNWAAAHPSVHIKHSYLNIPFWVVRALIYFAIMGIAAWRLRALGNEQDRAPDPGIFVRMRRFSAPYLILFTLTGTFAFFDWIMSIEPEWFSTMYGAMFLVGQMLQAFSFCVILLYLMQSWKPFAGLVKIQQYHDLGNLMLAFTMLWAYTSFSQFLIIWSGNLPEEISWYLKRFNGVWGGVAWFVSIFHFCVPFFILLMRFVKKNPRLLYLVAVWMVFVRLIDVYWVSMPGLRQPYFFTWTDVVAPIGLGGVWLWFFLYRLKARPLLPLNDPRLGYHELETHVIQDTPGIRELGYGRNG
ncbi:MAG TPA: hypothetical protein VFA04_27015 [Bryobacteraceae bacterium]|nr:hypothetical protein [Bryobacteraceae bacterium]